MVQSWIANICLGLSKQTLHKGSSLTSLGQPSVWMTLNDVMGGNFAADDDLQRGFAGIGNDLGAPRPGRPKRWFCHPHHALACPGCAWERSRTHRPEARLRMETGRCTAKPSGHGYAGTPHWPNARIRHIAAWHPWWSNPWQTGEVAGQTWPHLSLKGGSNCFPLASQEVGMR